MNRIDLEQVAEEMAKACFVQSCNPQHSKADRELFRQLHDRWKIASSGQITVSEENTLRRHPCALKCGNDAPFHLPFCEKCQRIRDAEPCFDDPLFDSNFELEG